MSNQEQPNDAANQENCKIYVNDYERKSFFASRIVIFFLCLPVAVGCIKKIDNLGAQTYIFGFSVTLFVILWSAFGDMKYKKTLLKNDLKILEFDDRFEYERVDEYGNINMQTVYKDQILRRSTTILPSFEDEFKESAIKYRMIRPDWKNDAFNFLLYPIATFLAFTFMVLCFLVYAVLSKFKIKLYYQYDVDDMCFAVPKNSQKSNLH